MNPWPGRARGLSGGHAVAVRYNVALFTQHRPRDLAGVDLRLIWQIGLGQRSRGLGLGAQGFGHLGSDDGSQIGRQMASRSGRHRLDLIGLGLTGGDFIAQVKSDTGRADGQIAGTGHAVDSCGL